MEHDMRNNNYLQQPLQRSACNSQHLELCTWCIKIVNQNQRSNISLILYSSYAVGCWGK